MFSSEESHRSSHSEIGKRKIMFSEWELAEQVPLVGLSNICYTLLNKFLQDSLWGFPTQRSHREQIIVPTVIDLELPGKVLKGIKGMGGIKPLVILPVAAFHFPVMTGCERTDQFMTDSMLL